MNKYDIDSNKILIKPLYWGLLMNIFIPVIILAIAYYIDKSGGRSAIVPADTLNIIFWVLAAVSIADGAIAIFLKQKLFFSPMIASKESFEDDLTSRVFASSIICYAITTAISIYGLIFYLLGGTFNHLLFFVFISFIAFQFIRPRYGFMEKVVTAQERLVNEGRFFRRRS